MKKLMLIAAAAAIAGCSTTHIDPFGCRFGTTKYGEKATLYTLIGRGGLVMKVTDYGGKVVSLMAPDAQGKLIDVTIGFDSPAGWEQTDPYFGAIIGRYGNRIAGGTFSLDGKSHTVPINDIGHNAALHGGDRGWDAYVWNAKTFSCDESGNVGIIFTKVFPAGEQGFPGCVPRARRTSTSRQAA